MASGQKQFYMRQAARANDPSQVVTGNEDTSIKLASKSAPKINDVSIGGRAKSELLSYPLENIANIPARMRFTVHKIQSYQIDPKSVIDKLDVPLLGFGGEEIEDEEDAAPMGQSPGAMGGAITTDTQAVGGPTGDPRNEGQFSTVAGVTSSSSKKVKESKFIQDAASGATSQRATNLRTQRDKSADIIFLHFPPGVVYQDGVNYNPVELGPAGQAALGAANSGGSLLSAVGRSVTEGIESIFGLVTGTLTDQAAQVAAARATQYVPREGVRAALQTATQTGINPGSRMIFDKPNIRNFTFQFRLIATSQAEALVIEKIIKSFRKELYPATIDIGAGLPIGFKFPNVYKIEFNFKGGRLKVPKILFSHLRDMTTTINGASGVFHFDGQPTEVDITLIFQEYRALSRQDVLAGF